MKTKTIEDISAKIVELKNNLDNFRNFRRNGHLVGWLFQPTFLYL